MPQARRAVSHPADGAGGARHDGTDETAHNRMEAIPLPTKLNPRLSYLCPEVVIPPGRRHKSGDVPKKQAKVLPIQLSRERRAAKNNSVVPGATHLFDESGS